MFWYVMNRLLLCTYICFFFFPFSFPWLLFFPFSFLFSFPFPNLKTLRGSATHMAIGWHHVLTTRRARSNEALTHRDYGRQVKRH